MREQREGKSGELIICPECGLGDQVDKVSVLYIAGLEAKRKPASAQAHGQDIQHASPVLSAISAADLAKLARRLSPPSGEKQATRPVHPDIVVIVFSLAALVFLYGMLTSQQAALIPAVAVLAVGYAVYFWKRKSLVEKFERQRAVRLDADGKVRRGIERWMGLYYCLRDDGVFTPGDERLTPADQINGYLLQQ